MVVVFVQIYPEIKKRQYKQALDAYEAARRDGRAPDPAAPGSRPSSGTARLPTAATQMRCSTWAPCSPSREEDQAEQWYGQGRRRRTS